MKQHYNVIIGGGLRIFENPRQKLPSAPLLSEDLFVFGDYYYFKGLKIAYRACLKKEPLKKRVQGTYLTVNSSLVSTNHAETELNL